MTYRTILVYADAAPDAASRLRIAADLAARSEAVLDGVFVTPPITPLLPGDVPGYVPPATWEALLESHRELVTSAAETARKTFLQTAEMARAPAGWTVLEDTMPQGCGRPTAGRSTSSSRSRPVGGDRPARTERTTENEHRPRRSLDEAVAASDPTERRQGRRSFAFVRENARGG